MIDAFLEISSSHLSVVGVNTNRNEDNTDDDVFEPEPGIDPSRVVVFIKGEAGELSGVGDSFSEDAFNLLLAEEERLANNVGIVDYVYHTDAVPQTNPVSKKLGWRMASHPGAPFIGSDSKNLVDDGKHISISAKKEIAQCKNCQQKNGCLSMSACPQSKKNLIVSKLMKIDLARLEATYLKTDISHRGRPNLWH
jgi:hypothetical protein